VTDPGIAARACHARLKHFCWLLKKMIKDHLLACTTKMLESAGAWAALPRRLNHPGTPGTSRPTSSRLVRLFTCQRA
jgi:hypothetical protein